MEEMAAAAEEAAAAPVLHMLRQLAESSRADHMMEILSYVLSFGSFVVFVWIARCAVASPTFRPESGRLSRLVHACVSERGGPGYETRIKKEKPEHSTATSTACAKSAVLVLSRWPLRHRGGPLQASR